MVSLPPHLQARPASRNEPSPADKAVDDLLARRPAPHAGVATYTRRDPRHAELALVRFHARVAGKSLEQLLASYTGRGSLLDLLV